MFSGTFNDISKSLIIKNGRSEGITTKTHRLIPSTAANRDSLGYIVRRARNINSIIMVENLLVLLNNKITSKKTIIMEKK
jgi:hypothetical protein